MRREKYVEKSKRVEYGRMVAGSRLGITAELEASTEAMIPGLTMLTSDRVAVWTEYVDRTDKAKARRVAARLRKMAGVFTWLADEIEAWGRG